MAQAKTKGAKKSPAKKSKTAKPKATKATKKKNTPAANRERVAKSLKGEGARERHPGRRAEASPKVETKHKKSIDEQREVIKAAEATVQEEKNELARRVDAAGGDGVSTTTLCEWLELSRQMVYKMVAERVDGKKLNQKPSGSSAKPKASKPKAPKSKTKAETKKPAKSKATKSSKSTSKSKSTKSPAKPNGRKMDIASFGKKSKGDDKASKKDARPKRPSRPKRKAPAAA